MNVIIYPCWDYSQSMLVNDVCVWQGGGGGGGGGGILRAYDVI